MTTSTKDNKMMCLFGQKKDDDATYSGYYFYVHVSPRQRHCEPKPLASITPTILWTLCATFRHHCASSSNAIINEVAHNTVMYLKASPWAF